MADGQKFKTGYVGPAIDFAAIGQSVTDNLRLAYDRKIEQERRRKIERNQVYGFNKALQETVPGQINNMFRQGAQLLLEDMQAKSAKAYETGNPEDISAYQAAKAEFTALKDIAVAKSAVNNQTRAGIVAGSIEGLTGTREEQLAAFAQYDQGEYTMVGGKLMYYNQDGVPEYWRESDIADVNKLYIPKLQWAGTNYMPENVGADIYESLLAARADQLQMRDKGYAVGQLNDKEAYALIGEDLEARLQLRGPELLEAIQAVGYKALRKPTPGVELSEADIANAAKLYSEDAIFGMEMQDGRNAATGSFNEKGEWVFDVKDEELISNGSQNIIGGDLTVNARKALKVFLEQTARRAYNLIPVSDETAALRRQNLSEIPEPEEPPQPMTPIRSFLGEGIVRGTSEEGDIPVNVRKVKASVPGRTYKFKISGDAIKTSAVDAQGKPVSVDTGKLDGDIAIEVENLLFDNEGNLYAFELATGPGILEGVLLDLEGTPIKSFQVTQGEPAFEEVKTAIEQVAAPSKTKRGGQQFLEDAEAAVKFEIDNTPNDEGISTNAHNKSVSIIQQLTVQFGSQFANSVMDAVMNAPVKERSPLIIRIFEEMEKGNIPKVDGDGQISFE